MKLSKKVYVLTNGCPENSIDSARAQTFFEQNGWTLANKLCDADVIIFSACGLTQYAEEQSIDIISQIEARKKPAAQLIVCGCLPKINRESFGEIFQGESPQRTLKITNSGKADLLLHRIRFNCGFVTINQVIHPPLQSGQLLGVDYHGLP